MKAPQSPCSVASGWYIPRYRNHSFATICHVSRHRKDSRHGLPSRRFLTHDPHGRRNAHKALSWLPKKARMSLPRWPATVRLSREVFAALSRPSAGALTLGVMPLVIRAAIVDRCRARDRQSFELADVLFDGYRFERKMPAKRAGSIFAVRDRTPDARSL